MPRGAMAGRGLSPTSHLFLYLRVIGGENALRKGRRVWRAKEVAVAASELAREPLPAGNVHAALSGTLRSRGLVRGVKETKGCILWSLTPEARARVCRERLGRCMRGESCSRRRAR